MGKRLEQALAEADAIEAAEADQTDRALPGHVKVSRPNRSRSKVLQVRLNPEELEAMERIAAARDVPVSTVARDQLLALIAQEASPEDLIVLVNRLVHLATQVREAASTNPSTQKWAAPTS